MRRDYVTLDIHDTDTDGETRPTLTLTFDGPGELLDERLGAPSGDSLHGERIDVAFRYRTAVDADDASGVLSLTDRMTGAYVLEVNALAALVLELVDAARTQDDHDHDDGDGRYRVVVRDATGEGSAIVTRCEKQTLLVYDDEGELRRQHSLIPSGVEL